MKAQVDQETCIGCELCIDICPKVFKMNDDKAIVHVDSVPVEAEAQCQKAADECPVSAITVDK